MGYETPMERGFKVKTEDIQEKITENTKGIILNSPSNPTGAVIDKEDIKGIADLATDNDIMIISDEIYEKIFTTIKNITPLEHTVIMLLQLTDSQKHMQ